MVNVRVYYYRHVVYIKTTEMKRKSKNKIKWNAIF